MTEHTTKLYNQRRLVVIVDVLYLLVLFALALIYLTDLHSSLPLKLPASLGSLPIGVPWFGALGAVMISLSGAFDHREDGTIPGISGISLDHSLASVWRSSRGSLSKPGSSQ
jgi:hypothetical protein